MASSSVISAVFCRAPGIAPGQGEGAMNQGEQLTRSQGDLNACEGHRYSRSNAFHGLVPIGLTGDSAVEPADMTWVTFDVDASYTRRVLGFDSSRGLPC